MDIVLTKAQRTMLENRATAEPLLVNGGERRSKGAR
jgi:hypothetical protein